MYIADLHIHSRYSRATSKDCVPSYLELWARKKGIDLIGTGDFTHPAWRKELAQELEPAEDGLYRLKGEYRIKDRAPMGDGFPRFVVSGEISSIYKKNGRVRKVHNLILLPGLEEAERLAGKLEAIGNIHSDGRPILGIDSRDLLEITLETCPRAIFVPAHIWTPHFSMFGAFSGFDTVEECFEDLTPHIRAFETGLSSDPPMNWRLSALDRFQMLSHSDAHSPGKLGREADLLAIDMSYDGLYGAIQEGRGLAGTIEFFPEEGKYHYDGHRKCHLCLSPLEAEGYKGICPVCGKKLTLGVSHRVEQLADREEGFIRPGAAPFESLVPLPDVIGASMGLGAASMKVQRQYESMLEKLGTEFMILRELPIKEISDCAGYRIGEGIRRLREGKVRRFPGFDGEYGTICLFTPSELEELEGQMSLFPMGGIGAAGPEGGAKVAGEQQTGDGVDGAVPEGTAARADGIWDPAQESGLMQAAAAVLSPDMAPDIASDMARKAAKAKGAAATRAAATRMDRTKAMAGAAPALDKEQLKAVRAVAPRIAVIAGPGTGKTRTLVARILYLLQERRVKPSDIMAVTFTRKAAQEMAVRLKEQLGKKGQAQKVRIGTFHGLCYDQLRALGEDFCLAGEDTAMELVREAAEALSIKKSPRSLRQMISRRKVRCDGTGGEAFREEDPAPVNDMEGAEEAGETGWHMIDQAVAEYQKRLAGLNALDLDDLLVRAAERAERGDVPPVPYLLVDEFQDISPLQYRLIQAWSRGGREVFIIGDPDQAIYGFRGADPESFRRFCREGETETIRLQKNYRSTPQILTVSAALMEAAGGKDEAEGREEAQERELSRIPMGVGERQMFWRPGISLEPVRSPGLSVRLVQAPGEKAEAIFVAKEIRRMIGGIDMLDAQESSIAISEGDPRSFADIAVLYRTHRQAALLEECFQKEGIPYLVTGRESFLEEDKVRGSLGFFRSLLDAGDVLSRRLCLKLLWGVNEAEAPGCPYGQLAENYRERCRRGDPSKLWALWQKDMGLLEDPAMEKLGSMALFYKSMEEMLRDLAFGKESDLKRCGGKRYTADTVTLMTMHAAKGLEFPAVFLYGLREGTIPPGYGPDQGNRIDMEEERRLLYVAMTRAKEELVLTVSGEPSVFIKQLPEGLLLKEQARPAPKETDGGHQMSLFELWPSTL